MNRLRRFGRFCPRGRTTRRSRRALRPATPRAGGVRSTCTPSCWRPSSRRRSRPAARRGRGRDPPGARRAASWSARSTRSSPRASVTRSSTGRRAGRRRRGGSRAEAAAAGALPAGVRAVEGHRPVDSIDAVVLLRGRRHDHRARAAVLRGRARSSRPPPRWCDLVLLAARGRPCGSAGRARLPSASSRRGPPRARRGAAARA